MISPRQALASHSNHFAGRYERRRGLTLHLYPRRREAMREDTRQPRRALSLQAGRPADYATGRPVAIRSGTRKLRRQSSCIWSRTSPRGYGGSWRGKAWSWSTGFARRLVARTVPLLLQPGSVARRLLPTRLAHRPPPAQVCAGSLGLLRTPDGRLAAHSGARRWRQRGRWGPREAARNRPDRM